MASIKKVLLEERVPYGVWLIFRRGFGRLGARLNGKVLGWERASVPLSSKIVGTKNITVGSGFFATGEVWIEAVAHFDDNSFSPSIRIGRNFRASQRVHISAIDSIEIGNECLFGSNIYVADHAHGSYKNGDHSDPHEPPANRRLGPSGAVTIGDNCWIGDNVVILGGVNIGFGAVIAANSVVTRDIPSMTIAAGAPAIVIKAYDSGKSQWVHTRN